MTSRLLLIAIFAVQIHVSADARAWVADGVPVCTATDSQYGPAITVHGFGGVIIAWTDWRNAATTGPDVYAQWLDPAGTALWTVSGVPVCDVKGRQEEVRIVADYTGGAFVAWHDSRITGSGIRVQRLSPTGTRMWTPEGVELYTYAGGVSSLEYDITYDGAIGVIVLWTDRRNENDLDVFAQRLDATGSALWETGGVKVASGPDDQFAQDVVSDGTGGAIMTWVNEGTDWDLYIQRLDASGGRLWGDMGQPLCTAVHDQGDCRMITAGAGGAIAVWGDYRSNPTPFYDPIYGDVYAQRVDATGTALWGLDGVGVVTMPGSQALAEIATDGADGAIIAWQDSRPGAGSDHDIYAQRLDGAGVGRWIPNGSIVSDAAGPQVVPSIASDGAGGAIIAWTDNRSLAGDDVYAQRMNHDGGWTWPAHGTPICTAAQGQSQVVVQNTGVGRAVVAWTDGRAAVADDIYANAIDSSLVDTLTTAVRRAPPTRVAVLRQYPNPFSDESRLDFELKSSADVVVDVFDPAGRRVAEFSVGRLEGGVHTTALLARDDAGRPLASGVYFYRVRAGGASVTRKMVVIR